VSHVGPLHQRQRDTIQTLEQQTRTIDELQEESSVVLSKTNPTTPTSTKKNTNKIMRADTPHLMVRQSMRSTSAIRKK